MLWKQPMKIKFRETGTRFFNPEAEMLLRIVTSYSDWSVPPAVFHFVLSEFTECNFDVL